MPPGLEGVSKILSTLEDTGVADKPKTTKELLSMIQSLAVFSCVQIDMPSTMPSPILAVPVRFVMPSVDSLSKKVLVLDMNGVLLRRYSYEECLPRDSRYVYNMVYKGGRDLGTKCLVRPDLCDFITECASIFNLCIWSSCTNINIDTTLRCFLMGMHPRIWKDQLSQKECVRLPFKLSDVKELQEVKAKPIFVKRLTDLLERRPEWIGSSILLVDDTLYKNMLNSETSMICPPTLEPGDASQDPHYLTNTLLPWLKEWNAAPDPEQYVRMNRISNEKDVVSKHVRRHWSKINDSGVHV